MVGPYSTRIKRLVREWLLAAHERELYRESTRLDKNFTGWRAGAIVSGELGDRIHLYHHGPARALFKRSDYGPSHMWSSPAPLFAAS